MSEIDRVLARALDLGDEGDWDGMARVLAAARETHPDDPYVLCWLGVAERQLGNAGAAYERFKQALAQHPEDPHLLAAAGTGLAAMDDAEAESVLRTATLLGPDVARARWAYGAYLSREGFFDRALEELRAALELDPDDPSVHVELGVAHALKGDLDAAADALDEACRADPQDGGCRVLLGLTLLELGRLEESAGELIQSARQLPYDGETQLLAALAASAAGYEDLAVEMLERARFVARAHDAATVEEAEERMSEGRERARSFLLETVVPGAFRERLMARP